VDRWRDLFADTTLGPRTRAQVARQIGAALSSPEGIAWYARASLELDPASPRLRYDLAAAFGRFGRGPEALQRANEALALLAIYEPVPMSYAFIPSDCDALIEHAKARIAAEKAAGNR
jgi:hypothetical protein